MAQDTLVKLKLKLQIGWTTWTNGATDMSSSGAQYVWHNKMKMDEEKSRHVVLARHFSTRLYKAQ
jgi:hypothetical protein